MSSNLLGFRRFKFLAVSTLAILVFLLIGSFAYSEPLRDPVEGELVVTLDVDNIVDTPSSETGLN
jgi:hypothetical protein